MNKIIYIFIQILLVVSVQSCSKDETEEISGSGIIFGTAINDDSNEPLQGASVTLYPSGRTVITGSNGHFEFAGLQDGGYLLQVSKKQFLSTTKSVTASQGKIVQSDVQMSQGASCLDVLVGELNFGNNATSKVFIVSNVGEKKINWSLFTDYTAILSFDKTSGTLEPAQSVSVNVTLNRTLINADLTSLPVYIYANGEELGVIATINRESAGSNNSLLVGDWSLSRAEFWSESDGETLYNIYSPDAIVYRFNPDYFVEIFTHTIVGGNLTDLDAILKQGYAIGNYYYDPASNVLSFNPESESTEIIYQIKKLTNSVLEIESISLIDIKKKEKKLFYRR